VLASLIWIIGWPDGGNWMTPGRIQWDNNSIGRCRRKAGPTSR
jgi:hypothetical protein